MVAQHSTEREWALLSPPWRVQRSPEVQILPDWQTHWRVLPHLGPHSPFEQKYPEQIQVERSQRIAARYYAIVLHPGPVM